METDLVTSEEQTNQLELVNFLRETFGIDQTKVSRILELIETYNNQHIFEDTNILEVKLLQIFQLNCFMPIILGEINSDPKLSANIKTVIQLRLNTTKECYNYYDGGVYQIPDETTISLIGIRIVAEPLITPYKLFYYNQLYHSDMLTYILESAKSIPEGYENLYEKLPGGDPIGKADKISKSKTKKGGAERVKEILFTPETLENQVESVYNYAKSLHQEIDTYRIQQNEPVQITPYETNIAVRDRSELLSGMIRGRDIQKVIAAYNANILSTVSKIQQTEALNKEQAIYRMLYKQKYGEAAFSKLGMPSAPTSPVLSMPIFPDIKDFVPEKVYRDLVKRRSALEESSTISKALIVKNRELIKLAEIVKTSKFIDEKSKALRDLLQRTGQKKITEYLVVDGIKLLCEHYAVLVGLEKQRLPPKIIAAKLSDYVSDIDDGNEEFCRICSAKLIYKERNENFISIPTPDTDGFTLKQDETYTELFKSASFWVRSYVIANFNDASLRDITERIINNIVGLLYSYMHVIYKKLNRIKNVSSYETSTKFGVYVNVYVAAILYKIVLENSKSFKIYGSGDTAKSLMDTIEKILITSTDLQYFTRDMVISAYRKAVGNIDALISKIAFDKEKVSPMPNYNPVETMIYYPNPKKDSSLNTILNLLTAYNSEKIYETKITDTSDDATTIVYTQKYIDWINRVAAVNTDLAGYYRGAEGGVLRNILSKKQPYILELNYFRFNNIGLGRDLQVVYGNQDHTVNLIKLGYNPPKFSGLHHHNWGVVVYAPATSIPKWRGIVDKTHTVVRKSDTFYLDTLCTICGCAYTHSQDDKIDEAVLKAIGIANFRKYVRYTCPITNIRHNYTLRNKTETCADCGYVRNETTTPGYESKFMARFLKERMDKSAVTPPIIVYNPPKPHTIPTDKVTPNELASLLGGKNKTTLHDVVVLGGTEEYVWDETHDFNTPDAVGFTHARHLVLRNYTAYIATHLDKIKNGMIKGNYAKSYSDLVYSEQDTPEKQYDLVIRYLYIVTKQDAELGKMLFSHLNETDKRNSKVKRAKLAQVEAQSNITNTDKSHIDLDNSDVDVVDIKAINLFSYDNMDYNGVNDDD